MFIDNIHIIYGFEGDIQLYCPEVTVKPWSSMSPYAENRWLHNTPGFSCHRGTDIPELPPEKTYNIYYVTFVRFSSV